MKKYMMLLVLVGLLLTGCGAKQGVDYSAYAFTDVVWTRDSGHDLETIIFDADGGFRYYCACGNPVNDSDLCEGYTYDDETGEIEFHCVETTEEMVTKVRIVEMTEDVLKLDFGGEIRSFEKEKPE